METYKLVLPEHLNHYGYLFGGQLLKWVDEAAYIAARLDYPSREFVTVGMDQLAFLERVNLGAILRFEIHRGHVGKTSVNYQVTVSNAILRQEPIRVIFSTSVTFVCIDANGTKQALPLDEKSPVALGKGERPDSIRDLTV
ncbi:MAG: acyl-CoA thioesterase [Magnetococcales bacterium]|nr:acyl-CoA thioesterase [Magnetococcales bacterium]MBF0439045.1 acyl-CoA thioesterase [Magnetococcales bacterium]